MAEPYKRKLIETSIAPEVIKAASAHEESVPREVHPATLHMWWARRPSAAATDGSGDNSVRIVRENGATLRFDDTGFEDS